MLHFNQIYLDYEKNLINFKDYLVSENVFDKVENFILVKSLPRQYPSFEINEILDKLKLQANNYYEIGYNCSTLLNILNIVDSLTNSITVVFICDSFERYISQELLKLKPQTKDWKNYSSGIVFGANNDLTIDIKGYNSITDNQLSELAYFNLSDHKLYFGFNENLLTYFRKVDLKNELHIIQKTLSKNNIRLEDIDAIITTNREVQRTELLIKHLGLSNDQVLSSRQEIGHTGCSDILFNLDTFIKKRLNKKANIILSANGLGYTWSSMLITITRNDT